MSQEMKAVDRSAFKLRIHTLLIATILFIFGSVNADAVPIMHVHDSSGNLGTVDAQTGDVNLIGNMGVVLADIAFDPLGNLFGIDSFYLYSINPLTAATSLIGH